MRASQPRIGRTCKGQDASASSRSCVRHIQTIGKLRRSRATSRTRRVARYRTHARLSHKAVCEDTPCTRGSARQSRRAGRPCDGPRARDRRDGRFRNPPLEAIQRPRRGFMRQPRAEAKAPAYFTGRESPWSDGPDAERRHQGRNRGGDGDGRGSAGRVGIASGVGGWPLGGRAGRGDARLALPRGARSRPPRGDRPGAPRVRSLGRAPCAGVARAGRSRAGRTGARRPFARPAVRGRGARCCRRARPRAAARGAARCDDRRRACGEGDVPALRRARLRALRRGLPGEPGRRSTESTRVTRVRGAALPRVVAAFALAAVAPLFFSAGGDVLNNMVLAAAYVVMALGLNLIVGFAGLLNLGYVAFYAIGAYTAAYVGSSFWSNAGPDGHGIAVLAGKSVAGMPGIHVNFVLVLVLAVAATAVAGAVIGVPTLRLRGDFIAIVTLAFGEIIGQVASNGGDIAFLGGTLTAGPSGIGPIDKIDLPGLKPFDAVHLRPWYWFALALVVLVLVVNGRLRDSRVGRAWIALRDDEGAAACAGIPIARTKLLAYATEAGIGGVA